MSANCPGSSTTRNPDSNHASGNAGKPSNRLNKLVSPAIFQEKSVGARLLCLRGVGGVDRQEQHPAIGLASLDEPRRLDAVHAGHLRVHQDDVGIELDDLIERIAAIDGLADDGDVRLVTKDAAETVANHAVVVHNEDTHLQQNPPVTVSPTSFSVRDGPASFITQRLGNALTAV